MITFISGFVYVFETVSQIAQAGLELTTVAKDNPELLILWLYLVSTGITGTSHLATGILKQHSSLIVSPAQNVPNTSDIIFNSNWY